MYRKLYKVFHHPRDGGDGLTTNYTCRYSIFYTCFLRLSTFFIKLIEFIWLFAVFLNGFGNLELKSPLTTGKLDVYGAFEPFDHQNRR